MHKKMIKLFRKWMPGVILGVFALAGFQQSGVAQESEEPYLLGACSRDSLETHWPLFQPGFSDLSADALEFLRSWTDSVHIIIFLGTWCSDSQREVPRFFEIIDSIQNPVFSYQLYGVDRQKWDGVGLASRYQVERVPTVIFLKGQLEIGRVVEKPRSTLEDDWATLLKYYQRMKLPEPLDQLLLAVLSGIAFRR